MKTDQEKARHHARRIKALHRKIVRPNNGPFRRNGKLRVKIYDELMQERIRRKTEIYARLPMHELDEEIAYSNALGL